MNSNFAIIGYALVSLLLSGLGVGESHTEISTDGTIGPVHSLTGPDYQITPELYSVSAPSRIGVNGETSTADPMANHGSLRLEQGMLPPGPEDYLLGLVPETDAPRTGVRSFGPGDVSLAVHCKDPVR